MRSIGNDIVSLNSINTTRTQQPGFYSKILSQTEINLFGETKFEKIPFENFIWLLWSIKESAYKYLQRITPDLIFSPTKFVVNSLQIPVEYDAECFDEIQLEKDGFDDTAVFNGTVTFETNTLFSKSIMHRELIHSVVNNIENFENIGWGIKLIESCDPDYQSIVVRTFLSNKLSTVFQTNNLIVGKSEQGIPIITSGNEELPIVVSLSHHDRLVAYSYSFCS